MPALALLEMKDISHKVLQALQQLQKAQVTNSPGTESSTPHFQRSLGRVLPGPISTESPLATDVTWSDIPRNGNR